jgi:hypothetical protein
MDRQLSNGIFKYANHTEGDRTMIDYTYMTGETEYENEGEWTKAELEAMVDEAESEIHTIEGLMANLKQDLWYVEQKHEMATYLLDNELWFTEEEEIEDEKDED